jgi:nitrite reductase/ring-hydroxylating ferredoxin subunit
VNNRSGWYPIGLAAGLERGTSAGTRLFGQEFVIWRDAEGGSHVWEDRCPHRGMRLSFGFVRGNRIACLYHGWQYDSAGQCRHIPAHPGLDVPQTIKVRRFSTVERNGIVWTYWDTEESAGDPPPEIGPITPVRTLTIAARLSLVAAEFGAPEAGMYLFADVDGLLVIAALQPLSAVETAAHLVIRGDHRGDGQKAVATWGQSLRDRVEANNSAFCSAEISA